MNGLSYDPYRSLMAAQIGGQALGNITRALMPFFSERARQKKEERQKLEELGRRAKTLELQQKMAGITGQPYEGVPTPEYAQLQSTAEAYKNILSTLSPDIRNVMFPRYAEIKETERWHRVQEELDKKRLEENKKQFQMDYSLNKQRLSLEGARLKILQDESINEENKWAYNTTVENLERKLLEIDNQMKAHCRLGEDNIILQDMQVDPSTGAIVEEGGVPFGQWQTQCINYYINRKNDILNKMDNLTKTFLKSQGKKIESYLPTQNKKQKETPVTPPTTAATPQSAAPPSKSNWLIELLKKIGSAIPEEPSQEYRGPFTGTAVPTPERLQQLRELDKATRGKIKRDFKKALNVFYPYLGTLNE